jgi:hypothetical protein
MAIRNLSGETVDGIVGIGTTNLGTEARLHVGKSAATGGEGGQLILQQSEDGSLAGHIDNFYSTNDYLRILKGDDTTSSALVSVFDLTNIRLGIGVYPEKALDVSGNARLQGGDRKLIFNNGSVETSLDQMAGAVGGLGTLGRFGVGTVAPNNNLQVVGNITFGTGATNEAVRNMMTGGTMVFQATDANHRIIIRGKQDVAGTITGNSNEMDFYEFGEMNFYTNVNTGTSSRNHALKLATDGNVGIGVASPGTKLDIGGMADPTVRIKSDAGGDPTLIFDAAAANRSARIKFYDNGSAVGGFIDYLHNGDKMNFGAGSSSGVTMTVGDGVVGIGTTTPGTILDVRGSGEGVYIGRITASPHLRLQQFNGTVASPTATANGERVGQVSFEPRVSGGSFLEMCGIFGIVNGTVSSSAAPTDLVFAAGSSGAISSNERMRIDSSGKVGIGTASPTSPLMIAGSGADGTAMLRLEGTGGTQTFNWISSVVYPNMAADKTIIKLFGRGQATNNQAWIGFKYAGDGSTSNQLSLGFYANNFLFNIKATGNVGIGTESPTSTLSVQGTTNNGINVIGVGTTANRCYVGLNSSNHGQLFVTGSSGQNPSLISSAGADSYISGGNVGIGKTNPAYKLDVTGSIYCTASYVRASTAPDIWYSNNNTDTYTQTVLYMNQTNSSNNDANGYFLERGRISNSSTAEIRRWVVGARGGQKQMVLDGPGTLTVAGDLVAYGSPSDKRYKENIKPVTKALDKVSKLQGVTFDWKESESLLNIKKDIGFIAQDVQEVLPELVRENEDGKLSLRDKGIVPILVEAIKELKAEIQELKKSK